VDCLNQLNELKTIKKPLAQSEDDLGDLEELQVLLSTNIGDILSYIP
jgi:hypothetical protein